MWWRAFIVYTSQNSTLHYDIIHYEFQLFHSNKLTIVLVPNLVPNYVCCKMLYHHYKWNGHRLFSWWKKFKESHVVCSSLVPWPNFSRTRRTDICMKNFCNRFSVRYINISRKFGLGTRLGLFMIFMTLIYVRFKIWLNKLSWLPTSLAIISNVLKYTESWYLSWELIDQSFAQFGFKGVQ